MSRSQDVASIESLEQAWCDSWNSHDMRALGDLLLPDADFVTVTGTWLRGRKEFEEHTGLYHATSFKHSTFTVLSTSVRLLSLDLALAHVKWRLKGDFDPDGTPRKPRKGIFTQVLKKSGGRWRILASQNANDNTSTSEHAKELVKKKRWD